MKKIYFLGCMTAMAVMGMSCSATLQKRYDQKHGTTSSGSDYDRYDRYNENSSGQIGYKKDYGKAADDNSTGYIPGNDATTDQRMLAQYAEMDKLGEVVLYELDILDSRWNVLLGEYKNARQSSREVISRELDQIGDDRITLYKAYTNIYRNGKTNWPVVKREVENTLRSVRKVTEK